MTPAQPSEKAQVKTPDKSQEKAAEKSAGDGEARELHSSLSDARKLG
jgi:hypothetical protein